MLHALNMYSRVLVYYAIGGLVAWWAIFKLPFAFPPSAPIRSSSYALGFNNHLAMAAVVVAVGLISVHRLLRRESSRLAFQNSSGPSIPPSVLGAMALVYGLLTAIIYQVAESSMWYGLDWESSHFLWKVKLTDAHGLRPYLDYQFEYGPALIYVPILIHKLLRHAGVSLELSYYISHYLLNISGLLCMAFILNRAVIPRTRRTFAFVALAIAGFLPNMGLNGVVLRYISPYFGLVLVHEAVSSTQALRSIRVFVTAMAAVGLCIALSAETGTGFVLAAAAYGLLSFRSRFAIWPVLAAVVAAVFFSSVVLPRSYYLTMMSFSQGANNLPLLTTSPHLLLYLFTMIWMVSKWLPKFALSPKDGALVSALGVLCVLQMPGALGRCDPYHLLFFGLGMSTLALADLANASSFAFRLYSVWYVLVFFVGLELINAWVFRLSPAAVASWIRGTPAESVDLDPLLKYDVLALPYGTYGYSKPVQQWLWSHRKVAPEYYMGGVGIYTQAQMAERLQDVGRFRFALIMKGSAGLSNATSSDLCAEHWRYLRKAVLYPWPWPCSRDALTPDIEMARYLQREYRVLEMVGDFMVLEKRDEPNGPSQNGPPR